MNNQQGEPVYIPLCEICGAENPQPVRVPDHSPLQLCEGCRKLFGFDQQERVGG